MSKDRKKLLAIFIVFFLAISTVSVFAFLVPPYMAEIDENIPLEETGVHTVLVKVNWNPNLEPIKFNHDAIIAELKAEAARTQEPVITYINQKRDAKVLNAFWLTNIILVEAETETIREMATFTSVDAILANFNVTIPANELGDEPDGSAEATWNIEKVRAPEVWEKLGITGEGIKFATTDSGLEIDHPDLIDTLFTSDPADPKYPGGWIEFDSAGNPVWSTPHDTYGHGTATYGLIVGDAAGPYGAVGMAPGAKGLGMHALSLPGGGGMWPQVIAGLQWVIDPYDEAGNHYPPAHVSSHSWGAAGYHDAMIEPIRNMWLSGHFVACSIGNSYECSTGSPGNVYECVGAGATDINDYVASWSSGCWVQKAWWSAPPADWPDEYIKPEVSAPGLDCIVPYWGKTWRYWSGTSFSSPHVGGAAVLMLSGNPSLTPDEIQAALEETAVWYDRYYPEPPDPRYGWGRLDAYEATVLVALPQGIIGTITDAETGQPIYKAEVYVHEADRTVYTDENGYYEVRLNTSTYTLTFSRYGYYPETVTDVTVLADQFTTVDMALTLAPPGYVAGYVYFEPTEIGIPGAIVEALEVPVPIEAETDAEGYYSLTIPPGTYDFEASTYGFRSDTAENIVVTVGETTTVNFYLTQPPMVAVVGDYGGMITKFLTAKGYTVDAYANIPAVTPNVQMYSTIIVNVPGSTSGSALLDFIDKTDENGVGVVWHDQWVGSTGVYWLRRYLGWPPYRYTYYSTAIEHTYYRVTATDDDIIPGWNVGYKIVHDYKGYYKDHAYWRGIVDGYVPNIGTVKVLALAGFRRYGYDSDYYNSQGIVKVTRDTNKWMLLSMHGNTPYTDVSYWHEDTETVFLNSINWVAKPHVGIAKFVVWDLKAEPEVGLWREDRAVSVGIKNVGWITGTDTVKMYVDGILEGVADVTVAPGEYSYPSWTVSRFDVGTYTVRVRHLTAKLIVRPPEITLQAFEMDSEEPLAGADVYGYYQKYAGPGWHTQWSHTYGGMGHSQHAQPIGDIDEDGVNEIIVGGYEVTGTAHIISFDESLGTYIEEYNWYVPGGSYHSPSGSCVMDLDGDGDNEFVVSWTYSGADGIYAYDWDGETLTQLDYYASGFVFDVYACDYDDDGYVEVLIANAPWGPTPWHIIAFGWENGEFVEEAFWRLSGAGYYWECPMIWSGDVDGDGKTEVVACISDSYYSTAGTWALHWNAATGQWEEEPVYTGLIEGGTHYGVTVGDVNGNGIAEIGVGNNMPGYIGAAAYLFEWNGVEYEKVWGDSWSDEYPVIEALAIDDADNDGENEFLAGGGNVHIIGWTGTEYVEEATITETAGLLSGVVIGDCDSDGLNEVKACDIIEGPGKEWIFKYVAEPSPLPGWDFKYFGTTDEEGQLAFDSPASVVDINVLVYKGEKTGLGYQYLLEKDLKIDDDITITYEPTEKTEAVVIGEIEQSAMENFPHVGVTWLWKLEVPVIWAFPSWYNDHTNIVASPSIYAFMHDLYVEDAWGTWRYIMFNPFNEMAYLPAGKTYEYGFAGALEGYVSSVQTDNMVTVSWDVTDGYGHEITGVLCDEAGALASAFEPVMIEEYEAMLATIIEYKPLITLYDAEGMILKSGYVEWYQKPITIPVDGTVAYAMLRFKAGPYGDPSPEEIVWWIKEG